jgi:hypothetical protein
LATSKNSSQAKPENSFNCFLQTIKKHAIKNSCFFIVHFILKRSKTMDDQPIIFAFEHSDGIHISPPVWSNHTLKIQPGDLTQFVPHGNGVYGYQKREGASPLHGPTQEGHGGTIFFENNITKEDFIALMRIAGVQEDWVVKPNKQFAIFTASSPQPGKDGYLSQIRLIDRFGLRFMFGAIDEKEYEKFPEQKLTMAETLWLFVEQERKRWGTSFTQDGEKGLEGLFGGDGDFAREVLSFGFMVENDYHHIYRVWSRAWLVTK